MSGAADSRSQNRLHLIRPLLPDDLAVAVTDPSRTYPDPWEEELAGLSPRAVAKRIREFRAGRYAAHQVLNDLKHPNVPIPIGKDRAPVWPPGIVGSISHTGICAMAAAAHARSYRMVGIDVEADKPLDAPLVSRILTVSEQAQILKRPDPLQMAKLIFSAKEAAYKAQFPLSRTVFGFSALETNWDWDAQQFLATFTRDVAPFSLGETLTGRFVIGEGVIMTSVVQRT